MQCPTRGPSSIKLEGGTGTVSSFRIFIVHRTCRIMTASCEKGGAMVLDNPKRGQHSLNTESALHTVLSTLLE